MLGSIVVGTIRTHFEYYFNKLRLSGSCTLVVTDGDDYCVFMKGESKPSVVSSENFVNNLIHEYAMVGDLHTNHEIAKTLAALASQFELKSLSNYIARRGESIVADPKKGTIAFESPVDEDRFFMKLLHPQGLSNDMNLVCRYTSLNSAFELLKSQKQNMCNMLCMNDTQEGFYADEWVFGRKPAMGESAFAESDRSYILSLMNDSKSDDLTMWRLYGDDAKGACIGYRYNNEVRLDGTNNFYFAKVSYGKKEKGREIHKELDFLRAIQQNKQNFFGQGWAFVFRRWGIWKHFFKSYHFSDEKEIRLLYYDESNNKTDFNWIKNPNSQIVTKMQLFQFDSFPLQIHQIIVGPKCPESKLVARQFELMAKENLMAHVIVRKSDISVYR